VANSSINVSGQFAVLPAGRRVTANFSGRGSDGNFLAVAEIWLENRIAIRYLVLSSFNR